MRRTKTLGDAGEAFATAYLQSKGYEILARNFRFGRNAEVDIIAALNDIVVFVEVKTRHSQRFGTPAEAVTLRKQKKLIEAATKFLQDNGLFDSACRFDVIEVFANDMKDVSGWTCNHIMNAFEVGAG